MIASPMKWQTYSFTEEIRQAPVGVVTLPEVFCTSEMGRTAALAAGVWQGWMRAHYGLEHPFSGALFNFGGIVFFPRY